MEHLGKVQKWIDFIMADKLEAVAIESKELQDWDIDKKLNKLLFKALLCLSHTAERCKPSDTKTGRQIYDITKRICRSMKEILNLIKYYACLYHIVRKLIATELFSEAMRVTVCTFPSDLVSDLTSEHFDMYPKFAALWHQVAIDLIDSFPNGLAKNEQKLILEFLNNELSVFEVIAKERTTSIVIKIFRYLVKLDTIADSQTYRNAVDKFFKKIDVSFIGTDKYDVYYEALRFITMGSSSLITSVSIEDARKVFYNGCEIVEKIFGRDEELSGCFSTYKNMGIMILKPVDDSDRIAHWNFSHVKQETLNVMYNFKKAQGMSANIKMIGYILQPLAGYWEKCIKNSDYRFLNSAVLTDLLNVIKLNFHVANSIPTEKCETCNRDVCSMKKHTYGVTVISTICLVILSKITAGDLFKDMFKLIQEILEENVAAIYEMKQSNCAQWSILWNNCGVNIYNLSVVCFKYFYEETVFLFSLLCSCVVKFEGIAAVNSSFTIKNPLSYSLHKLSGVHFNNENYREALTPCALNGILSYQNSDTKAFRMWTNIKNASDNSPSILKMTMLSCLREDSSVISEIGLDINLKDYNLNELCLQELRSLYESRHNMSVAMYSVLDELKILDSKSLEYTQGVQLLGYHLLQHGYDDNFSTYFNRAIINLNEDKPQDNLNLLIAASLRFYTFVTELGKISNQTKAEMERAKFALQAANVSERQQKNNDNIVPAYSKINITEDSKLYSYLKQAMDKWSRCLEKNLPVVAPEWQLTLTLRTLVIVGEYSHLHRFSTLETKAWELSFKLASHLNDTRTLVYVIGRSMSSRMINGEWIDTGNNLANELTSASDPEANNAVALFKISLSDYYFRIGKNKEAAKILQKVLADTSPLKNISLHLSSMDTVLRNYHLCSDDDRSTNYMVYMVKCLYSMLSLMEYGSTSRVGKEQQLYSSDVLFTSTSHLSLPMNSLLSFREISSHLVNRLKLSQASGITLRVAENLKNLCFIDLSRMQLDNCLVKLQGLEYILQIEYVDRIRYPKDPGNDANEIHDLGVRDSQVRDASPNLRKEVFRIPDFLTHRNCSCYKCSNVEYRYLVLSTTHIRAQLFFLQGHLSKAMEYFGGAFYLRRKLIEMEIGRHADVKEQHSTKILYHPAEYVQLLLDFSRILRAIEGDNSEDGLDVATAAVEICQNYNLVSHTVYVAAQELLLEYQFCRTVKLSDFSKFTVPDASSIDVSKYTTPVTTIESSAIATPAAKPNVNKPKTMRRNRTPPLLKLTKVSMELSDDEESPESPKSSKHRTKSSHNKTKSMSRKNFGKYLDSTPDSNADNGDESVKDEEDLPKILNKAALVFPELSRVINKILKNKQTEESDKARQVVKLIDDARPKSEPRFFKSRIKNKDDDASEIVNALKKIMIRVYSPNISDGASSSRNSLTSSFDILSIDKKTKKKLDFFDNYESISSDESGKLSVIPKPEHSQNKVGLKISERMKKATRSRSIETERKEKPIPSVSAITKSLQDLTVNKDTVKKIGDKKPKPRSLRKTEKSNPTFQVSPLDDSGLVPPSDVEVTPISEPIQDKKHKSRNSRRNEKSESKSSIKTNKNSQLDDSGIVPPSDVEEKAIVENLQKEQASSSKYPTGTLSRMTRSKSRIAGSSKTLKTPEDNSDRISISDSDDENLKRKNSEPKKRRNAAFRTKKSDD